MSHPSKSRRYSSDRERKVRQEMAILEALYRQEIAVLKERQARKLATGAHPTSRVAEEGE